MKKLIISGTYTDNSICRTGLEHLHIIEQWFRCCDWDTDYPELFLTGLGWDYRCYDEDGHLDLFVKAWKPIIDGFPAQCNIYPEKKK